MNKTSTTPLPYGAPTARTLFVRSFVIVFVAATGILFSIDFVPESRVRAEPSSTDIQNTHTATEPTLVASQPEVTEEKVPVRIRIGAIGVDTPIVTPASTDIAVLDRALLSGAVHYPGSTLAGEMGNMLIFGHSSYLPVIKNKSFKAFNELGELTKGEEIEVFSETHRYVYAVDTVTLTRAEDTQVPMSAVRPTLTLATCNTFGAKQERYVVTAHLVRKSTL